MTQSLQKIKRLALSVGLMAATPLAAQFSNPDFVVQTPGTFIAQPDLDGDGTPDLVVVDRTTGIIRPAVFTGAIKWLDPVPGGIAGVDAVAVGNIEDFALDSIAITSESANRINLFSLAADTLNLAPRNVFNEVFGIRELAALEEPNSGTPGTIELIGLSEVFDTDVPGIRDFMTMDGGQLVSYANGFPQPDAPQRGYNHFLVEEGVPMLGFFYQVAPGQEHFRLAYILDGSFKTIETDVPLPDTAQVAHASFDESGFYQFLFHSPGSEIVQFYSYGGSSLNYEGDFVLSKRASAIFAAVIDGFSGFFALSGDGSSLEAYAFDGSGAPVLLDVIRPGSRLPVTAGVPLPDGSLLVLSGDPSRDPSSSAERFAFNGKGFESMGDESIPSIGGITAGSNVLLFADKPFIAENPNLTGRLGAGVWTSAVAVGASVEAEAESYGGSQTGLTAPEPVDLGTPPPGTSDALGNQVARDISLTFPGSAIGSVPGSVSPSPDAGSYAESISVQFVPTDPKVEVFHRILPDGNWKSGTGPIGPFYQDVSISYFGLHVDGRRTPIRTASYTLTVPPSDLDSDNDGVPDYVEIDAGLDPVNSGDDADGDGYGDLIELLAGSDPGDSSSLPPGREVDSDGDGFSDLEEAIAGTDGADPSSFPSTPGVLNFQNVFDLIAVPYSHDGTAAANPFVSSLEEELETPGGEPLATNVRLFNPASALIGFDRTALHNLGAVTHPSAYIDEVSIASPDLFMVVATDRTFNIDIVAADRRIGRQLSAIVQIPEASLDPVPYTFGSSGGLTGTEAAAWVNAAKAHFLSIDRPMVVREFNLFDTLALLLTEMKVETILQDRGILTADRLTLTGFRSNEVPVELAAAPGDGSRSVVVPPAVLADLRYKAGPSNPGYRLKTVAEVIEQCVDTDPAASVQDLRTVAEELFRISAATANANPGTLVTPMDALRQFLRTGNLDNTGYGPDAPLDATTLASAYSAVPYILGKEMARPVEFRELVVPTGGLSGTCTLLEDSTNGDIVSLVNFRGEAFPFPDAFNLPAGTVILVEGYTDVSSDCPADLTMEVIPQPQLVTLPVQSTGDANANLIPDDLEDLYTSPLDPFGDSDGDGYTDLQEILSGSNPLAGANVPDVSAVDLGPPVVSLDETPTTFIFNFQYPEGYADDINFLLFSGPDLQNMSTNTGVNATHTGGGTFQLIINKPASLPAFFRFQMLLD